MPEDVSNLTVEQLAEVLRSRDALSESLQRVSLSAREVGLRAKEVFERRRLEQERNVVEAIKVTKSPTGEMKFMGVLLISLDKELPVYFIENIMIKGGQKMELEKAMAQCVRDFGAIPSTASMVLSGGEIKFYAVTPPDISVRSKWLPSGLSHAANRLPLKKL